MERVDFICLIVLIPDYKVNQTKIYFTKVTKPSVHKMYSVNIFIIKKYTVQ